MTHDEINERLELSKKRLKAYQEQELKMLTDGVQAYGVGSRNVTRYNMDLNQIRQAIKELQNEVDELTSLANGGNIRKAVGVVIRDW